MLLRVILSLLGIIRINASNFKLRKMAQRTATMMTTKIVRRTKTLRAMAELCLTLVQISPLR